MFEKCEFGEKWYLKSEFCEKLDFKHVNFVKKMRFWKCEFSEKKRFWNVNFVKNDILKCEFCEK